VLDGQPAPCPSGVCGLLAPARRALAAHSVGVLVHNRMTLRPLLDLHTCGRRAAVRAGKPSGPACARLVLGLAHQGVEVLEGLLETLPCVGEPSGLRKERGSSGSAVIEEGLDPARERGSVGSGEASLDAFGLVVGQHDTKIWRKWRLYKATLRNAWRGGESPLPAPGGRSGLQSQLQSRAVLASFEALTGTSNYLILLVRPVGLEPTTSSLKGESRGLPPRERGAHRARPGPHP
jgi:hypothetical protein